MGSKKNRRIFKRIKNEFVYLFIRTIVGFFRFIPRKMALAFGSVMGRIAPFIARKEYHLALKNLSASFGSEKNEEEIRRLARENFRCIAMNFVDAARLKKMSFEEIQSVCVPHNIERLQEFMHNDSGAILLVSHTGCWELMGVYLMTVGLPITAIARRMSDPRLEKMLLETRKRGTIKIISRGHNTREIIRKLREKNFLFMLIDQDTKVKGVFVDFFGKPAHTATAPATLSLRYNVPIFPAFTCRDESHRHHVFVGEPVTVEPTGETEEDVLRLTAKCSKIIEEFIRENPEQWVWFHRRWKTKKR